MCPHSSILVSKSVQKETEFLRSSKEKAGLSGAGSSGAGFSLRIFVLASTKPHRLKPAPQIHETKHRFSIIRRSTGDSISAGITF